jgi:hypothetical protein
MTRTKKIERKKKNSSAQRAAQEDQNQSDENTEQMLFTRSEYYSRFKGTTAHAMDIPSCWNSYHRSEKSRSFSIVGNRKKAIFPSPCAEKKGTANSFYAHTGGYHAPFTFSCYGDLIKLEKQVPERNTNTRDQLLDYKFRMAQAVVQRFTAVSKKNAQRSQKSNVTRPIVYVENDYPCVLVALPALNPYELNTESAKYWSEHPKVFQKLLICIFIARLNVNAIRKKIPIEMVIRSSFGHNLPSICETNKTFRINTGIVPQSYAFLIGETLAELNQLVGDLCDETSQEMKLSKKFLKSIEFYNAQKLIDKIENNEIYEKLKKKSSVKNKRALTSNKVFSKLYEEFNHINEKAKKANKAKKAKKAKKGKKSSTQKGISLFKPVELKDKTIWQIIRQAANTKGNSVLYECFRQNGTEDWFINQMMDALLDGDEHPVESSLKKLVECLLYEKKVSMDYSKIHEELKCAKREFEHSTFEQIYADDLAFANIVEILCNAFLIEGKPSQALYATLEHAIIKLFTTYRGSDQSQVLRDPDYGSDSDFSEDLSDNEPSKPGNHVSHTKLRVCSGMKSIMLAQYGALAYLHSLGATSYTKDVKQMYYEVAEALGYIPTGLPKANKVRASWEIWHFDLNHCNANNSVDTYRFEKKLAKLTMKTIAILDYTSSSQSAIKEAARQCFSNSKIEIVIFVNSGLKNEQGGADFNPYGEVRIFARDRKTSKEILKLMKDGLSENDKLTQKSHEMVRVCKRRGLASSFYSIFVNNKGENIKEDEKSDVVQQNQQQPEVSVNTANLPSATT